MCIDLSHHSCALGVLHASHMPCRLSTDHPRGTNTPPNPEPHSAKRLKLKPRPQLSVQYFTCIIIMSIRIIGIL